MKNRELHLQYNGTINSGNDTVNSGNDTVNSVNDTVFSLIKQNNKITAIEISEDLKVSLSTAKRKIKELKDRGEIERIGSNKNGHWKVV